MSNRIQEARKKAGITQTELAVKTGISRGTIARYETTKMEPTLRRAKEIADALGCKVDDLIVKEE